MCSRAKPNCCIGFCHAALSLPPASCCAPVLEGALELDGHCDMLPLSTPPAWETAELVNLTNSNEPKVSSHGQGPCEGLFPAVLSKCKPLPCLYWVLGISTARTSFTCGARMPEFTDCTTFKCLTSTEANETSCPRQGLGFLIVYGAVLREELSSGQAHPVPAYQTLLSLTSLTCSVLVQRCKL